MKWILDVDKKLKISYIFTNAVLIFLDSIVFIIPVFTGYLVDRITVFHNYDHFFLLCFFFFIFVILKYLGSYFTVIKLDCLCIKITSKIKALCYKNLNQLDAYFYEHHNRGELMTTCTSDIERIRRHLVYNIRTIGKILLTFFCSFIYLMTIHIPFTLILLIPGIFAGFLSYRFMVKMKPEYEKSRELITLSNDFISDNIEANKVIKTFSLEQDEIKRMQKINQKCVNKEIENGRLENKFYMQIDFIAHFMNVLFLLVGGYLFIHNKLTMGQLIVFKTSLSSIRAPFFRLSGILNSVQRYIISKNKVIALVSAKPKILLNGSLPLNSLLVPIVFQNVCIAYDNKVILDHLNLEIKPFDTIAFIGKTGSGKSSIVNLLLGFITPFSGKILINGKDYLDYDMKDIRKKIGYVTQSPFLFSDSIYNNIRYGVESITREEAKKYAEFACCEYVDDLVDGIETVIGEKGVGLSGGEKQRLSLARALAVQPDILLLDDITSALDIETEEKINSSINSLKYKSTKIIIASKIVSVMHATCIYVLNEGKIIEFGTHQELLANKGYYYELYKMQKGEM